MAKKSSPFNGVTRVYGRAGAIADPETGEVVARPARPDLIEIVHTTGTIYLTRETKDGGALVLRESGHEAFATEVASAEVGTRKSG